MSYNETKPSIYPPYCFEAAPTYNVSSFLRITGISSLQVYRNIPGIHFHRNLPIRWVRIVGVIVAIYDFPEKRVYTIDDSSGLNIECILFLEPRPESTSKVLVSGPVIPPEYSDFDVGHVVDLRGPIIPYRRQKAIKIRRMKRVPTTQHELILWERRLKFKTEILDEPWVLSDEEIWAHRRQAERADATARKRKHMAQQEGVQRASGDGDPFKIRKLKPADIHPRKLGHRSREPPTAAGTASDEKAAGASRSETDPHGRTKETDPYTLRARKATGSASSTAPNAPANRRSSNQDDSFRITKVGSRKTAKPLIQSSSQTAVEPVYTEENSYSGIGQSESVSKKTASGGSQAPSKPSQKKLVPAPKPKMQRVTPVDIAGDPYVIKSGYSRRKPTVSEPDAPADPFKLTVSRKGPCSEKSHNTEAGCPSKGKYIATTSKDSKHRGRFGTRVDVDDPFRLRKQARK